MATKLKIFIIRFRKEKKEKYSWVLDMLSGAERKSTRKTKMNNWGVSPTIRKAFNPEWRTRPRPRRKALYNVYYL